MGRQPRLLCPILLVVVTVAWMLRATCGVDVACGETYSVKQLDTCYSIAKTAGITVSDLKASNPGLDCANLSTEKPLCMPVTQGGSGSSGTATSTCSQPYVVQDGDSCWTIATAHGVQVSDLQAVNPGMSCSGLHPSDQLCLPAGAKPKATCSLSYIVKGGDYCWGIATSVGVQVSDLTDANPGLDCNLLKANETLCLPEGAITPATCNTTYTVQQGDMCAGIASTAGISMADLQARNPRMVCNSLQIGQLLCLPNGVAAPTAPDAVTAAQPCSQNYTVQSGDYCFAIATSAGISLDALNTVNPGLNCDGLHSGQVLCLPAGARLPQPITSAGKAVGAAPVCSPSYTVKQGDVCWAIAAELNITLAALLAPNPDIGDCHMLVPGQQLCLPEGTIVASAPPPPAAGTPCSRMYTVQPGDLCVTISSANGIRVEQLLAANPEINTGCTNLEKDQQLCLPPASADTACNGAGSVAVKGGETCNRIIQHYPGMTLDELLRANPKVNSDCTNLVAGQSLCLPPGYYAVPKAGPAQPSVCNRTYGVRNGDTCNEIAQNQGVHMDSLLAANPNVSPDCSNLFIGQRLCIPAREIDPNGSMPCNRTYPVKAGDFCTAIAAAAGVSFEALLAANPTVNNPDCSNLFIGQILCLPDPPAGPSSGKSTLPGSGPTSQPQAPSASSGSGSSTNIGAIVGGAVGGAVALLLAALLAVLLYRRRRRAASDGATPKGLPPSLSKIASSAYSAGAGGSITTCQSVGPPGTGGSQGPYNHVININIAMKNSQELAAPVSSVPSSATPSGPSNRYGPDSSPNTGGGHSGSGMGGGFYVARAGSAPLASNGMPPASGVPLPQAPLTAPGKGGGRQVDNAPPHNIMVQVHGAANAAAAAAALNMVVAAGSGDGQPRPGQQIFVQMPQGQQLTAGQLRQRLQMLGQQATAGAALAAAAGDSQGAQCSLGTATDTGGSSAQHRLPNAAGEGGQQNDDIMLPLSPPLAMFERGGNNSPTAAELLSMDNSVETPRPPDAGGRALAVLPSTMPRWHFQMDPSELVIGEQLGSGGFGEVHKGTWAGTTVAIKLMELSKMTNEDVERCKAEVRLMCQLRHPRIVQLLGAAVMPSGHLAIVMELVTRGSLYDHLHRARTPLDPRRRLRMALDVARGMAYLHGLSPPLVHRDLKSPNLLVSSDWTVKLCDFGLSKPKYATFIDTTSAAGTPAWMAPEVLLGKKTNEKTDVYSYAMVLYELVTGKVPWGDLQHNIQLLNLVGHRAERPDLPDDIDPPVAALIQRCWAQEAADRPSFLEVLAALKGLKQLRPSASAALAADAPSSGARGGEASQDGGAGGAGEQPAADAP